MFRWCARKGEWAEGAVGGMSLSQPRSLTMPGYLWNTSEVTRASEAVGQLLLMVLNHRIRRQAGWYGAHFHYLG
ncbi:hypothetical protein SAMN03159444_03587 [Pseudomonas sp. NFACC02]|nr:hypothetical protein SAMN03159444_03587 [Pseudomonas sp. NFACC02]